MNLLILNICFMWEHLFILKMFTVIYFTSFDFFCHAHCESLGDLKSFLIQREILNTSNIIQLKLFHSQSAKHLN